MKDISVVMPVFNAEKTIMKALANILCQIDVELEIICIDDGSTDESYQVLKFLAEKDSRVKILKQNKCGPGNARNLGVNNSLGRYIVFIDADDYVELPLRLIIDELQSKRADILQFGYIIETPEGVILNHHILDDRCLFDGNACFEYLYRQYYGPSACFSVYDSDFLHRTSIRFRTDNHFEDAHFFRDTLLAASRILLSSLTCYHYVRYPQSRSNQWGLTQFLQLCQLQMENIAVLSKENINQTIKDDVFGFVQTMVACENQENTQIMRSFLQQIIGEHSLLAVYGTGSVGRSMMKLLMSIPNLTLYYCDSDVRKAGNKIDGILVVTIDELVSISDIKILIGSSFVGDIFERLLSAGLDKQLLDVGINKLYRFVQ